MGRHFADHGAEVGARTPTAWAAAEFGSAPDRGQFVDLQNGSFFYRFEPATNKTFLGTTAGQRIKTFYRYDDRPDDVVVNMMKAAGLL